MSTNLRLGDELARALRDAAERSGRSQQEIMRAALAKELGLAADLSPLERAVRSGAVEAPKPFVDHAPALKLPKGTTSLDLLERDER
jgi:hypothetical protein